MATILAAAVPAQAQTQTQTQNTDRSEIGEGFNLLQEGTRLMLRGLLNEMEPALRDLGAALDDLSAYHPPEIMPNGDIIIRRKEPLAPPLEDGETEI